MFKIPIKINMHFWLIHIQNYYLLTDNNKRFYIILKYKTETDKKTIFNWEEMQIIIKHNKKIRGNYLINV